MKKKIVIISSLLTILMLSIGITLAFLTDAEETKNTFTIGKVDISLYETAVDENGTPIKNADPVIENDYHLLPGKSYVKDPTITVKEGSDDSYVRMLVTLNKYEELISVFGTDFAPENYVTGYDKDKWVYTNQKVNTEENTITYEFRYYKVVNGYDGTTKKDNVLEPLFTTLNVPNTLDAKDFEKIEGLEISIIGHAIQVSGLETADIAWDAFTKQYGE